MKSIWLPAREEFDRDGTLKNGDTKIVGRNEAVIINPNGLNEIIKELNDYRNFILREGDKRYLAEYLAMNEVELRKNGCYSKENDNEFIIWKEKTTYHGREDDKLFWLINPYPNTLDFIKGEAKDNFDMQRLLGVHSNLNIEYFLDVLEGAKKAGVDVQPILMATLPEIGKFSSGVLDCIEFVEVETRNIIELEQQLEKQEQKSEKCRKKQEREKLLKVYHALKDEISPMYQARQNYRVLSLAKRIGKII